MSRTLAVVLFVIYIIIGVIVAAGHHYFEHLDAVRPIALAVLAVVSWLVRLLDGSLRGQHHRVRIGRYEDVSRSRRILRTPDELGGAVPRRRRFVDIRPELALRDMAELGVMSERGAYV